MQLFNHSLPSSTSRNLARLVMLLAVLATAGRSPAAHAQSATAGAIGGTVTDVSGARLPGTTVTITSTDTGITRTVKANASGEFTVPDLTPGTYKAVFTADGFETYQENTIAVTVGSVSNVAPKLKNGSVADKVEVSSENLQMHVQDSAISTTIDQAQIDNLPINGRRWSDFARLTPGVVSNSQGFGLLSFRGISFLLNNNTVDGADDNQAYYSEARGRTRTAYTITPSAVQEFQVNTSNYSAQYGRSAGGVINTVTKSGGNQFHGEVFFYDRDVDLGGAASPYSLITVPNAAGQYISVPIHQTDWRKEWGGGVGGPLIKDKLFWFYAFDQERRNFPFDSRPTDTTDTLAPSNPTLPQTETCSSSQFTTTTLLLSTEGDYSSCALAALYGVSFQAGSAYYTQGLGIVNSETGVVPRTQDQVINLPKLDWQINDRNHLSLMYNRFRYSSPNGLYSQTSYSEGPAGLGNDNVKEDFGIVRLATVINSSMVNDALVQYGRDFEYDYQDKPIPNEVPLANNTFGAAASIQIGYYTSTVYAGSNPDLTRYADPDERRLQLLDGLTWTHGKHTAKFGLEYNKVSDYDNNLYNGNGTYSYDWAYTFIADYLNYTTGIGGPITKLSGTPAAPAAPNPPCVGAPTCYDQQYYSYGQTFGNPAGLITTREYAGYATDDWRIAPNLTLTLGVRYEYEYVPQNPFPNNGNPGLELAYPGQSALNGLVSPLQANTNNTPDDRNNFGPRVGFSWNVFGDGKTVLRGGYGIYYGRIINSNILQTDIDSGAPNGNVSFSTLHPASYSSSSISAGCGPTFPNVFPNTPAALNSLYVCLAKLGGNTSTAAYFDNHFQNPQIHEADLALEQNMGRNTTFSLTYMMSLGRELPTAVDQNLMPAGGYAYAPYAVTSSAPNYGPFYVSPIAEDATALSKYPALQPNAGYVVYPHGGKIPPPLPSNYMGKFFLGSATYFNKAYYQILKVESAVNSSYNALAFQVDHRWDHGFSLLTNFTWSHALDENPYESTVVPGETFFDPTNPRSSYGNSNTDVRLRYVGAIIYQPQTHYHGFEQQLLGGWRIAPLVQAQTGLPYSATVVTSGLYNLAVTPAQYSGCAPVAPATTCTESLIGSGVNASGSSGANVVPWLHRNSYNYPKTAVFDMRVGKNFYLPSIWNIHEPRLEFFAELFNVMNHQNITGVNTEAYTLTDSASNVPTFTPYPLFGQYTNSNNNYTYTPRQLQVAVRLHY
jgi:hypothetical protein